MIVRMKDISMASVAGPAPCLARFLPNSISMGGNGGAVGDNLCRFGFVYCALHTMSGDPAEAVVELP